MTRGATMTTDPTQPMSPPASAGSGAPEPEPRQPEVAERPEAAGQPAPTVQEPVQEPRQGFQPAQPAFQPAQPSFQPAQPAFQPAQPARPGSRPSQPGSRQPAQPPYVPRQDWAQGEAGEGGTPGRAGPAGRRRRLLGRRWTMAVFGVIVLLILLVIGDRVAVAVAENQMADQFVSNGLPVKPSVTIEGFPFLTQLLQHDFRKVDISASNVPAGPVSITSAKGTLTGMHINGSFNGATVDHANVTLFISFGALAAAGGLNGTGITVTPAGPNLLKITAGIGGVLSDTEEARVTQTGPQQISIQVVNSGSPIGGILSSFGSFSFSLPKGVPPSLHITGVSLNSQGLTVTAAADHANLTKPSS